MPDPRREGGMVPTEYFNISPNHPEFQGELTGEIIESPDGPSLHLSRTEGRRLSESGRGDVVIMGISQKGWDEIARVLSGKDQLTMDDVKRILASQEFITWDNPGTGH
jgi:hypothetical protein